jgi:hypothetical protein
MRRLPKFVHILGRKIPVRLVSKAELDKLYQGAGALFDAEKRLIMIDKDAPIEIQRMYLFHEMHHAMHSIVGLDQFIPGEILEILCQSGASFLEDFEKHFR